MLTLVLTRHGLTDRSTPEQHLGQRLDISINTDGERQAEALGRRLAPVAFDRVLTSPLFRARETAEVIVAANGGGGRVSRSGGAIEADPRLREMDYGAWEGRTYREIDELDASYRREWERAPDRLACPGGESGDDVAARVTSFLRDLLDEHRAWHAKAAFRAVTSGAGSIGAAATGTGAAAIGAAATGTGAAGPRADRPVLAVGHGTTNRILLCVALGVPVADFRRRFVQGQVNLTALRWEVGAAPDEARLLVMNDRSHLRGSSAVPWT
jgi:broad specificity phosphatase PhoE